MCLGHGAWFLTNNHVLLDDAQDLQTNQVVSVVSR